ncbi:MAG: hypothetical protein ACKOI1_00160, partial [Bacteroidota bacterium]
DIANLEEQGNEEGGFVVGAGTQLAMVQRIVPNNKKTVYQRLGDLVILVILWVILWLMALRSRRKMAHLSEVAMNVAIEVAVAAI